jgi:hypothetical protein
LVPVTGAEPPDAVRCITVSLMFMRRDPASRPARLRLRRAGGLLLLAIQLALAVFALAESRASMRLGVHVEQDGTRHDDQHSDETCGLCAVRAQSALPGECAATPATSGPSCAHRAVTLLPPTPAHILARRSRAPPTLPS